MFLEQRSNLSGKKIKSQVRQLEKWATFSFISQRLFQVLQISPFVYLFRQPLTIT